MLDLVQVLYNAGDCYGLQPIISLVKAILNIIQSGTRAKVEIMSTSDNKKSEIYFRLINGKWELFVFKDSCNFFNN